MSHPYSAFCDDFYVNMRLSTQLTLPHGRETVLHFCERLQKEFPAMTRFKKHENGDISIEEGRDNGGYRWATIEGKRLLSGHVNPESISASLHLHQLMLE